MWGLTWKDLVTTVLTAGTVHIYYAISQGIALPLISGVRGGIVALALIGIFLCAFGSAGSPDWSSPWMITASVLGGLAALAIVIGLITANQSILLFLTCTLVALWFVATLRHLLGA